MLPTSTRGCQPIKCCLSCYHDNAYGGFNFGVQVHGYVEFAYVADGAVRQTNFALLHFNAGGGQCISDVVGADRTEQLAFVTGGGSDSHFQLSQLGSASFGRSFFVCSQFFQLSTTLFERSQVGSGRSGGFAEWQQVVTTVTGLNVYLIAQVAQVGDFFQKDQLHVEILLTFNLHRSRNRYRPLSTPGVRENQSGCRQWPIP